jgi:drug/metabolite transporter (DMT)-like permease
MGTGAPLLGGMVALLAAVVWGSGDYLGGLATRGRSQYVVLLLGSAAGLVALAAAMVISGESPLSRSSILLGAGAGISGVIGIAALYRGLADAHMAQVSPISAVVGVILPVLVGLLTQGAPPLLRWIGIAIGLAGIWLASSAVGEDHEVRRRGLRLALIAGCGFGGFFVLIARVDPGAVFGPLVVSKSVAALVCLGVIALQRGGPISIRGNRLALLAGLFDAGGNVFYLLAARLTRMDIAALIASMSPAVTVALAAFLLRQRASPRQLLGVAACLVAIAFLVV